MYPKMEKIGDIFKLLACGNPKRIIFDLSEDGKFYNAKIYIDIVDKSKDEEYEGYIECKYVDAKYNFDKDTKALIEAFAKIDIILRDENRNYRNTHDVLKDMGEKYNSL